MKQGKVLASFLIFLLVILAACAPRTAPAAPAAPQVTPAARQAAAPVPVKPAWEEKWDKWMSAAKAEGTVVTYAASVVSQR